MADIVKSELAFFGAQKAVKSDYHEMFSWPIITEEHEQAVLEVLRAGNMSGIDITKKFEQEYAKYAGTKYALACNNGTAALHSAMHALGVGAGDEIIGPVTTYWASLLPAYSLGASIVFADVDPDTLCIDPKDIENRITPRSKLIVVVHIGGMPADMDSIMAIAKKHNLKVLEDCSHAHGTLYKGKIVGSMGDAAGLSMMSGKSFAIGEGGMLLTNEKRVYEKAILFGHYARHEEIESEDLIKYAKLPWGGYKYRMHQLSSAMGLVQLNYYPQQMAEIDKAMNYLCDKLEDVPGVRSLRACEEEGSTRGGWYAPYIRYAPQELGGLSVNTYVKALQAEGVRSSAGSGKILHTHPLFSEVDVYGHGRPTQIANLPDGVKQPVGNYPGAEELSRTSLMVPWFKHYLPEIIDEYVSAFKKVADNYKELLDIDDGNEEDLGSYSTFWASTAHL